MKKQKMGEIMGCPVFFEFEQFKVTIAEKEFKALSMPELKRMIKLSGISEVKIPVIFASSGDFIETEIVRIDPEYGLIPGEKRKGFGVPGNINFSDAEKQLYPVTPNNLEILKKHIALREKGWQLIREADAMDGLFEPFPKNHFREIMAKGFKELEAMK